MHETLKTLQTYGIKSGRTTPQSGSFGACRPSSVAGVRPLIVAPASAGVDGGDLGLERGFGLEMLKDAYANDLIDACVDVTGVVKVWSVVLKSLHFYNWFLLLYCICVIWRLLSTNGKRDVCDDACI